ncbi:hypothetical protein Tco_0704584 [Tanacetum coccineum]|uniref:Uncharacterized protein n=1 Tax=Tanacetum coccineum TaxID=301880 RepID=A0ABQ4Y276_9ASTR
MEGSMTESKANCYPGIMKISYNGRAAYALNGGFLDDLREIAFSETNREDAIEHIENFFEIVDPIKLPNVSYEQLGLRFSYSRSFVMRANGLMVDAKKKWDPTNLEFVNWLSSKKFPKNEKMDQYTKNALWDYWKNGGDEVTSTNENVSDLEEGYWSEDKEATEIFRIETNLFDFETPLCIAL